MALGAGYQPNALGVWPPGAPIFNSGFVTELYWSPLTGSDLGSGNRSQPVKTAAEVARRIAFAPGDVNVHMRSARYELPSSGVFLHSRVFNGRVRFFGDSFWDSTVNNVLHAEAAQAGTGAEVVVLTGLAVDAFVGKTIEVTAAIGGAVQRKTVRSNTATDVIPCGKFSPAPAPGDAVRITESRAVFGAPASDTPVVETFWFMEGCLSSQLDNFAGFFSAFGGGINPVQTALVLENVAFEDPAPFALQAWAFGQGTVYAYGVEFRPASLGVLSMSTLGTQVFAGVGLNGREADYGWGIGVTTTQFSNATPFMRGGQLIGCVASLGDGPAAQNFGVIQLFGGRCARLTVFGSPSSVTVSGDLTSIGITYLMDARGTGAAGLSIDAGFGASSVVLQQLAEVQGGGGGIQISGPSLLAMFASLGDTQAGLALEANKGARVLLGGTLPPPFASVSGALYQVPGIPGVANAFFAAPGTALLSPTDASCIQS